MDEGQSPGWIKLRDGTQAQDFANRRYLVVASYKNSYPSKLGNIGIVRPSTKSAEMIMKEGTQTIQAGIKNYNNITVKHGFKAFCTLPTN